MMADSVSSVRLLLRPCTQTLLRMREAQRRIGHGFVVGLMGLLLCIGSAPRSSSSPRPLNLADQPVFLDAVDRVGKSGDPASSSQQVLRGMGAQAHNLRVINSMKQFGFLPKYLLSAFWINKGWDWESEGGYVVVADLTPNPYQTMFYDLRLRLYEYLPDGNKFVFRDETFPGFGTPSSAVGVYRLSASALGVGIYAEANTVNTGFTALYEVRDGKLVDLLSGISQGNQGAFFGDVCNGECTILPGDFIVEMRYRLRDHGCGLARYDRATQKYRLIMAHEQDPDDESLPPPDKPCFEKFSQLYPKLREW